MVTEDEARYLENMEAELQEANMQRRQLTNAQLSLFGNAQDVNLIRFQLDLREDLDYIYHLLKGDEVKQDEKGNEYYAVPNDKNLIPFNDYGVHLIMNLIQFYLNRNTILSNYDEDTINWKVHDFGYEVVDLIFNKYEEIFYIPNFDECKKILMDKIEEKKRIIREVQKEVYQRNVTEEELNNLIGSKKIYDNFFYEIERIKEEMLLSKIKLYPIIVLELVDSVHSTYLRALHGGERTSLRTARTVTQSENLAGIQPQYPTVSQHQKPFKIYNPKTWFGR